PRSAGHSRPANRPAGFADLARRMTSRTTDLIAIGIVIVASLTLGRQVRDWWRAPPTDGGLDQAAGSRPAWEDSGRPISLEVGDLPLAITRLVVEGDLKTTIEELVRHCRLATAATGGPWREPDEAEGRLLEKTVGLTPVAEEPGVWQVFVLDERFPMVAGVRL